MRPKDCVRGKVFQRARRKFRTDADPTLKGCTSCDMDRTKCTSVICEGAKRADGKNVVFKEVT